MKELDKYQSIKQYALSKGISTQSVYRQIKRDSKKGVGKRKLEVIELFGFKLVKSK